LPRVRKYKGQKLPIELSKPIIYPEDFYRKALASALRAYPDKQEIDIEIRDFETEKELEKIKIIMSILEVSSDNQNYLNELSYKLAKYAFPKAFEFKFPQQVKKSGQPVRWNDELLYIWHFIVEKEQRRRKTEGKIYSVIEIAKDFVRNSKNKNLGITASSLRNMNTKAKKNPSIRKMVLDNLVK
jgi:hypothetical protein